MAEQVVFYTRPGCPECDRVKELLTRNGVDYTERDVAQDPVAGLELRRAGPSPEAVPVTLIDGEPVIGWDEQRLRDLLDLEGARRLV